MEVHSLLCTPAEMPYQFAAGQHEQRAAEGATTTTCICRGCPKRCVCHTSLLYVAAGRPGERAAGAGAEGAHQREAGGAGHRLQRDQGRGRLRARPGAHISCPLCCLSPSKYPMSMPGVVRELGAWAPGLACEQAAQGEPPCSPDVVRVAAAPVWACGPGAGNPQPKLCLSSVT